MFKWLKRGTTDASTEVTAQTTKTIQASHAAQAASSESSPKSSAASPTQRANQDTSGAKTRGSGNDATASTDATAGGRHAVPLDDSAASQLQPLLSAEVMEANNLPANVQQALGAIVAIAQQMDARLARVERQLNELDPHAMGLASTDDIHALRLDNARLSAEIAKSAIALRDRIDEVEFNRPATPAHEERVNRLAQQIATLSDSYCATDK